MSCEDKFHLASPRRHHFPNNYFDNFDKSKNDWQTVVVKFSSSHYDQLSLSLSLHAENFLCQIFSS